MNLLLLTPLVLNAAQVPAAPRLSIRVEGDGYLRLARAGQTIYASRATLTCINGALGTTEGDLLLPRIAIKERGKVLRVDLEGNVTMDAAEVGSLVLAVFPANTKLVETAEGFTSTVRPKLMSPGDGVAGVIKVVRTSETTARKNESGGRLLIQVRTRSEVDGDHFTVGDIATLDGNAELAHKAETVDMGALPLIGTERGLVASHIAGRLRSAGLTDRQFEISVPERATVVRKSQVVSPEQILDSAKDAAVRRLGVQIEFVLNRDILPLTAPPGEVALSAEAAPPNQAGIVVTVTARQKDRIIGSRTVALAPASGSEGVRIGDPVQIRLICNGAVVEAQGKAISAGWVGQTVTVQTTGSPSKITGIVSAPGIVEVRA